MVWAICRASSRVVDGPMGRERIVLARCSVVGRLGLGGRWCVSAGWRWGGMG